MKDKDPNEDEFNQDEQDNINEADDSFGLPDLDFDTLEEAEEEEKQEETPAVADDTADTADEAEASDEPAGEPVAENEPDAGEEETEEVAATAADNEEEDSEGEEETEEPAVAAEAVSRTYVPPKPESNAPKMIAIILAVIVVSVGVWYFMFYRPQAQAAEKARIEAEAKKAAAEKKAAEAKRLAEERQAAEAAANEAADADESAANATAEGTFSTISAPTGRYYVIVESFVDSDLAADYGNKLASEGISTSLLAPKGGKKRLHRLAIGEDFGSFAEAQDAADKLKAEYGEDLWVLKY